MVTKRLRARAYSRVTGYSCEVILIVFPLLPPGTVGLGTIDGHSITGFLQVNSTLLIHNPTYTWQLQGVTNNSLSLLDKPRIQASWRPDQQLSSHLTGTRPRPWPLPFTPKLDLEMIVRKKWRSFWEEVRTRVIDKFWTTYRIVSVKHMIIKMVTTTLPFHP